MKGHKLRPAFCQRLLVAAREYESFLKVDAARRERRAEARRVVGSK
jgi:hypothetical protein